MATSTGSETASATLAAEMRQRSCDRSACTTSNDETKPCCDNTCIVEIARRDCNSDPNHRQQLSSVDEEPCETHYLKAKEAYSGILENIGCICRILLSLNLDSCCVAPPATLRVRRSTSSMGNRFLTSPSMSSSARPPCEPQDGSTSSKKACCSGNSASAISLSTARDGCHEKSCSKDFSSASSLHLHGDRSGEKCCSSTVKPIIKKMTTAVCGNSIENCCAEESSSGSYTKSDIDLEKADFPVDHVVLSVQGMTCCDMELRRSLSRMMGITNVKTSVLLSQADFDLSTAANYADTIEAIEKATGFSFTRITPLGHKLDLEVDSLASAVCLKSFPYGVSEITRLGKHTIRVIYDPKLVGARDLMSDPFFRSPKLAPNATRISTPSGRAQIWSEWWETLLSLMLTIPVLIMAWAPIPEHKIGYGAASLVLATIIQTYIAWDRYTTAYERLFSSHWIHWLDMNFLVVLSTTTAYTYSIIAYGFLVAKKPLSTGTFFETSTLVITLIKFGSLVSESARKRAMNSVSIESLQAARAILVDPETHEEQDIDARLLQYEDIFKAFPDTTIATDGTVTAGTSEVDESMITGEAKLINKRPGSPVVAGSINHSGTLTIRLTRLPGENTIKSIGLMVDEAKSSKTKIEDLAARVAGWFAPIILGIAILFFVIWVPVGKGSPGHDTKTACINAMMYAISVLIVSCPCAIGLAVPTVCAVAGGVAAKNGLVFKTAETIEIARKVSHVIFDKTGTLTQSLLSFDSKIYPMGQSDSLAPMLLGLTSNSKHPVSTAVASHLESSGVRPAVLEKVVSVAGNGMEAIWEGKTVRAGNPYWLGVEDSPVVKEKLLSGVSMLCVSVNGDLVAVFGLKNVLRPDAADVIQELKKRSIKISILSGDNEESVKSIARILGVPESNVRFKCSPGDKQTYVKQMLDSPKSVVMFCGDGTNDAVALAQASIGVHINGGTDIAQSAADAIIIRPALTGIIILIDLSKAFFHRVVFNFVWSMIYNIFAILLAGGVFPNARIPPGFLGLGELVSILPVIIAGFTLRWYKFGSME